MVGRTGRLRRHQREAFEALARARFFPETKCSCAVFRFIGPDFERGLEPFLETAGTFLNEEGLSSSRNAFLLERPAFLRLR